MANPANVSQRDTLTGEGAGTRALTTTPSAISSAPMVVKRTIRQRPEILSARPTPGLLWDSYRRRFWLATLLGLLAATVVSGALWWLIPAKYEVYAHVQISTQVPYLVFQ